MHCAKQRLKVVLTISLMSVIQSAVFAEASWSFSKGEIAQDYLLGQSINNNNLLEVEGVLSKEDAIADDGSLYDSYILTGYAGQTIAITLESIEFDTYLILKHLQNNEIASNDDIDYDAGNYNSFIHVQLPVEGHYEIVVNGLDAESRGRYRLVVQTTSDAAYPALSEVALIQVEANRLLNQGILRYGMNDLRLSLSSLDQSLFAFCRVKDWRPSIR